jgi:hypothetical protein
MEQLGQCPLRKSEISIDKRIIFSIVNSIFLTGGGWRKTFKKRRL